MVDAWPDWPGHTTILAGPVGSGRSHIANVWAGMADAQTVKAEDFAGQQGRLVADATSGGNILIENVASGFDAEKGLFHLLNAVREAGSYCLITSRSWPREWNISLLDLRSRLLAAQLVELAEPDDLLLKQVMVKLFSDRQLEVEAAVIDYCVLRMERSLESAAKLVDAMDNLALSTKRTISRKTAADALKSLGMV